MFTGPDLSQLSEPMQWRITDTPEIVTAREELAQFKSELNALRASLRQKGQFAPEEEASYGRAMASIGRLSDKIRASMTENWRSQRAASTRSELTLLREQVRTLEAERTFLLEKNSILNDKPDQQRQVIDRLYREKDRLLTYLFLACGTIVIMLVFMGLLVFNTI